MGRMICHYDGLFFEWSSIVDAPVTRGMTREQYEEYYAFRHGDNLSERMGRALATGTSSVHYESLEDLIRGNRAGPGETEATFEEIIRQIKSPDEVYP